MIIKLTRTNGSITYVNKDHIIWFQSSSGRTQIYLTFRVTGSDHYLYVQESVEEICKRLGGDV